MGGEVQVSSNAGKDRGGKLGSTSREERPSHECRGSLQVYGGHQGSQLRAVRRLVGNHFAALSHALDGLRTRWSFA